MTLQIADRVWDVTSTSGTGTVTLLNSPPNSYQSFGSVCADGDTIHYAFAGRSPTNVWEVGLGTYHSAGPTLSRTIIFSSSAGGAAVTLSGITDVMGVFPAREFSPPTYYISSAGSNSNSGLTPVSPWQTIAKVNSLTPTPGTTFLFRGGDTFSGTITAAAAGLSGFPITYGSYGDQTPAGTAVPPNAIISSGNGGGFSSTDFSFITVNNLTFTGNGPATNTAHGLLFTGATKYGSGITVSNCIINGYGLNGFLANSGGSPVVYWDTWVVRGNKIFNCGGSGIQFATNNSITVNNALANANITVQNNTVYDVTGQNSTVNQSGFSGGGIVLQGCDTCLIDGNFCHDNAYLANQSYGGTGVALNGIYFASGNNCIIQKNEVYNQIAAVGGDMVDAAALQIDFGSHNVLVQYNYFHDNFDEAITLTTGTGVGAATLDVQKCLSNITIRYNILANNGAANAGVLSSSGIEFKSIQASTFIKDLYIYNNTIYATINQALGGFGPSTSFFTGLTANNLIICNGKTMFANFSANAPFPLLLNNAYVGGSPVVAGYNNGSPFSPIATLLANMSGELLNGTVQTIYSGPTGTARLAGLDPIITAPSQTAADIPLGKKTATQFCLQPSSPYADTGLDLSQVFKSDLGVLPNASYPIAIDFDFKGQVYVGDVIGSIACSRASVLATDLMPYDPQGRAFNTFGANALRVTAGRGLLIEEARTQFLATPGTPATQTTASLASGNQYVLWVNGPGTAVVTAGTGTPSSSESGASFWGGIIASHGSPAPFIMTGTGTVVVTVNGNLNQFQLENDPNGDRNATSFISALGARDADVVTATGGTTIGATIQTRILSGAANGVFLAWFRLGSWTNSISANRVLVGDNSGVAQCAVIGNTLPQAQHKLGAVTTTSSNSYLPIARTPKMSPYPYRQTFGAVTDTVNGQAVSANGEAATVNATTTSSGATAPVHFGNNVGATGAFNGYIERIITGGSPNDAATMVTTTSIIPVISINNDPQVSQDFFGNPVPGVRGTISIGAHQPTVPGDVAMLDFADQTLSGGANVVPTVLAIGNTTIDAGKSPLQNIINGGAFTITAPAIDGSMMLLITNNASAGAVAFSGFSVGANTGDALTTTNTNKFTVSIWRINGVSGYRIAAHQ